MLRFLCAVLAVSVHLRTAHSTYDGVSFKGSLERPLAQAACYRLFSNKGDYGCRTSSSGGSTGAIFEISNAKDIEDAKQLNIDLAYFMPSQMLNKSTIDQLHRPQGIIIIDEGSIWSDVAEGALSPDVTTPQGTGTPQRPLTYEPDTVWNLHGNGLSFESFAIPIVRADPFENEHLRNYAADNRRYGYHSTRVNYVDFNFYMGKSALTSKDCLEWRDIYGDRSPQCIPLGGNSVWGTAAHIDDRKKVLGTVGIDSTAMFHDLAFGANDAAASIAAFLGAIEAIGRMNHQDLKYQILFFAANAEEWGYAGSRRFVRDLMSFQCSNEVDITESHKTGIPMCADPVYPSTLFTRIVRGHNNTVAPERMFKGGVALDQIGSIYQTNSDGDTELFIHSADPSSETTAAIKTASETMSGIGLTSIEESSVPPSPLTSFMKEFGDLAKESAVITGYNKAFRDPRYHSHYDNASYISEKAVIRASELFAKSLVIMAGGDASEVTINATWTAEALNCMLTDWNCDFFAFNIHSEKANAMSNLGFIPYMDDGVSFYGQSGKPLFPPSYFSGVLSPFAGQPVVNHEGMLYGKYTGTWDEQVDLMYFTPNLLEAILRTSMSYHLGEKDSLHFLSIMIGTGDTSNIEKSFAGMSLKEKYRLASLIPEGERRLYCDISSDCDPYFCEFFSYEYPMVKLECLLGVCVCPAASYHVALDPGLEADSNPGYYTIVDETAPIYTEPNWSNDVGVIIYPRTNDLVIYVTVAIGSVVALFSLFYTYYGKSWFAIDR